MEGGGLVHVRLGVSVLCCLALAFGCRTTTLLRTSPPGALVTVDGTEVLGLTPIELYQKRDFGSNRRTTIEFSSPEHLPLREEVRQVRDQSCFQESLLFAGIGFWFMIPLMAFAVIAPWCSEFEHGSYHWYLEPRPAVREEPAL